MKKLLAIAALLLASSAAQAQYSFDYGGKTIRIDPDRGTVQIPGVYDNTGRKGKRSRDDDDRDDVRRDDTRNRDDSRNRDDARYRDRDRDDTRNRDDVRDDDRDRPRRRPQDARTRPTDEPDRAPPRAPAPSEQAAVPPAPPPVPAVPAAPAPVDSSTATAAVAPTETTVPAAPSPTAPQVQQEPPPAPRPSVAAIAPPPVSDPDSPLGVWQTEKKDGKDGKVRIEQCGPNLCGYSIDKKSGRNGEQVLINMRPGNNKWSGRIVDPSSGSKYDSTITLKGTDRLRVQGCAFGGMFCGGQTWTRLE
jgi:hypothetical protein